MAYRVNNMSSFGIYKRPIFFGDYGYQGNFASTSDASSYTFSNKAIGPASSDRLVIAVLTYTDTEDTNHTSTTIGGISATHHTSTGVSGGAANKFLGVTIASAVVPTGTTASIVATMQATMLGCHLSLYSVIGLRSITPIFAGSTNNSGASSLNRTATNLELDGILIAGSAHNTNTLNCSWTNATEDHDSDNGEDAYSSAQISQIVTPGSRVITANWGSSGAMAIGVASWR